MDSLVAEKLEINLRSARNQDYAFYEKILEDNMGEAVRRNRGYGIERRLLEYERGFAQGEIYLMEVAQEPIGLFQIEEKPSHLFITELQIVRAYRGKGIGSNMLWGIEGMALQRGFNKICLEVFQDNPARRLYERQGYVEFKQTEHHSVLMEKLL